MGSAMAKFLKRKRLLVDRQLQGALLFRIVIYWCFAVLTVCLVTLSLRLLTFSGPVDSFFDVFALGEFFTQHGIVILASLVLVPIIAYDILAVSNRFAGPLSRMRRSLQALGAGEPVEPLRFREWDFLQDLAEEFNTVADRVEQLRRDLDEAQAVATRPRDFQTWTYE
jgi:hypothetical protein